MKLSNRIFNNPTVGSYNHRKDITVLDNALRNMNTTAIADGISLQEGDRVLFTTLNDSSLNNKVYKVHNNAFILAVDGLNASGAAHPGDCLYVQQGSHAGELWSFESAWELLDVDTSADKDTLNALGADSYTITADSPGSIKFQDTSEGTVGHVWTSTDVNGSGNWEAASGGGGGGLGIFTITGTDESVGSVLVTDGAGNLIFDIAGEDGHGAGAGSHAYSFALGNTASFNLLLSGSITLTALNNTLAGKTYRIRVIQGGSGSYTIAWPANVKWPGGTPPTLSTSVGAIDIITLYCDGTDLYGDAKLGYA